MGRRQHHRGSGQLGVGQVHSRPGDSQEAQPALGCHPINGMSTLVQFVKEMERRPG